ncbi:uncharacterized protein LOC135484731 [Lineus longissimus]|uniref:uncharacterized protein LOC135484731 n=1 Tax=Lineus longissimus TaxID=88925 RepID=UPI002B4CA37C
MEMTGFRMLQLVHIVNSILVLMTIYPLCASMSSKILKSSTELLEKESKRMEKEGLRCALTTLSLKTIDHNRLIGKCDKMIPCLIKYLEDKTSDRWAWCVLAQCYKQQRSASSLINNSFKQASKLHGRFSEFVQQWHFIGPFGVGKMELDGDPLEFYGGIQEVAKRKYKKGEKFYSELVPNAKVKWTVLKQRAKNENVQISPEGVQWNDLVNSIGSLAIYEWQGWAVGEFAVNENNLNLVFQCLGVHTFYIDSRPVTGDVYRREVYWYSVSLTKGIHTIYVKLRTKVQIAFQCVIEQAANEFNIPNQFLVPDLVDGHLFSDVLSLQIVNLSPEKWLSMIRVSVLSQSQGNDIEAQLLDDAKYFSIAPGQVRPISIRLLSNVDKIINPCSDIQLKLNLVTSLGQKLISVTLRCRTLDQSFIFTFVDHDGSVQHAAAIHPTSDCDSDICPTLLTLHGTSVPAQNQADSYKYMKDGNYVFGLDGIWTLAPTRHGAHNWEGPGALTAMTALEKLAALTNSLSWIKQKASAQHVIFAGHSMGGHGAWHLGTHFPDRALGLISLAGWIKKEEYGDSNLFFMHDIATSHTDPAVKTILEACITENDADRHVSNIQDVPVLLRIGAKDRTVHPYFVRRMYRILNEYKVNVTYTELAGKEHWWWDTWQTNDGGAVNDPKLRDFTLGVVRLHREHQKLDTESKYSKAANEDKSFTLSVINPAFGGSLNGLKILQQTTPFRISTIKGVLRVHDASLETANVARFSIGGSSVRPLSWKQLKLTIDGQDIEWHESDGTDEFCLKSGKWTLCILDDLKHERGPSNLGPARRVAEQPFLIVIGTKGSEMKTAIFESALYIANLFHLTSDALAPIVKDTDITEDIKAKYNLILLGGPEENHWSAEYISKVPISIKKGFQLGSCSFSDQRSGAMFLAPNGQTNLAMVLMGLSVQGFRDVVTLASPTIPPMTRSPFSNLIPDFAITGPEFKAKGPGGYSCVGFWGNRWELRPDLISCVC